MVYSNKIGVFFFLSIHSFLLAENLVEFEIHRTKSLFHKLLELDIHPKHIESILGYNDAKNTNTSIPLFRYQDTEFYGNALFGHPGQNFKVIFDTAWANSWIPSALCPDSEIFCQKHEKYFSTKSSTYKKDGRDIKIEVGDDFLSGFLSTDLVHIGQKNITNQTFAEVTHIPKSFSSIADGVLGLAFQSISSMNVVPFLDNMVKQKQISKKVFSFYFNRDKVSPKGGTLFLGGSQKKHYLGNFTYVNLIKADYWRFEISSIHIKKSTTDFCGGEKCPTFVDTSSSTISVPNSKIEDLARAIRSKPFVAGKYVVDCNLISTLPIITLNIGGRNFDFKPRDYIREVEHGAHITCFTVFEANNLPSPYDKYWTLGASFMARFYVEFDAENERIGFANVRM